MLLLVVVGFRCVPSVVVNVVQSGFCERADLVDFCLSTGAAHAVCFT